MVGHGGSSASSYLADPTSPIPSHCASIVMTSTVRVTAFLENIVISSTTNHVSIIRCSVGFLFLCLQNDLSIWKYYILFCQKRVSDMLLLKNLCNLTLITHYILCATNFSYCSLFIPLVKLEMPSVLKLCWNYPSFIPCSF